MGNRKSNYFTVHYNDKSEFQGNQFDGDWNLVDDKPIEKIKYVISNEIYYIEGYKQYTHQFEKMAIIGKSNTIISAAIIVCREENKAIHLRFDFRKKKFLKTFTKLGLEYVQPIWDKEGNLTGWTEGQMISQWKDGVEGTPKIYKIN